MILIDIEKELANFAIYLLLKQSTKWILRGWPHHNKPIYDKPTAKMILNGEKLKAFPGEQEQDKNAHY